LEVNRQYPIAWRIGNATVSYVAYVGQLCCPCSLAPCSPRRPVPLPPWQVAAAVLTLAAITAVAIRGRRQRPYLLVGWLWYLVMLAPVIGLVQFGAQAEADRFSYLPQIGLAIALVWTAMGAKGEREEGETRRQGDKETRRRADGGCRRSLLVSLSPCLFRPVAVASVLAVLIVGGWRQTCYWHDSETLWNRVLACHAQSTVAHNNLGVALRKGGRIDEAMWHYRRVLEIDPDDPDAHDSLGNALASRGQMAEAIRHYQAALDAKPNDARVHYNLGTVLADCGRLDEALGHLQKAVALRPDYSEAHNNLGTVLRDCGRIDEAVAQFRKALDIKPDYAEARANLDEALATAARTRKSL
jgi:Flp pilus assembly protein TadD